MRCRFRSTWWVKRGDRIQHRKEETTTEKGNATTRTYVASQFVLQDTEMCALTISDMDILAGSASFPPVVERHSCHGSVSSASPLRTRLLLYCCALWLLETHCPTYLHNGYCVPLTSSGPCQHVATSLVTATTIFTSEATTATKSCLSPRPV